MTSSVPGGGGESQTIPGHLLDRFGHVPLRWDLPRSPASLLLTVRLAEEHGVAAERVLAGVPVTPGSLRDPATEVTAAQEVQVIRNLLAALPDVPGLGLDAGRRYHLTTYGIWGFALISSASLRDAADVALPFVDLTYALCDITLEDTDDEVHLVLETGAVPHDVRLFALERDAAAIRVIGTELVGVPVPLTRIEFTHDEPTWSAAYDEVFGIRPVFGAERNVAVIDRSLALEPLPQADELAAAGALAACRDLLERRQARTGVSGRVRDVLLEDPSAMPGLPVVAASLHLSERTLRRRLDDEGTSFRALVDEVREQLATELLVTGGLPVEAVARRLGYAEPAAFTHAFRRWKGTSPRAYRLGIAPP